MEKPSPTRTLGPLHLEDLEQHRFEDLVRQLLYDFRRWRALEATGRSGGDDGFDARAYEITGERAPVAEREDGPDDESEPETDSDSEPTDRLWLIQCKRERTLGPAKMKKYLKELPETSTGGTYGIVFVAACDFSLATRNAFREAAREIGFAEAYLWGKGEIEDLLFQPKNDHLLFAYFGVSLRIRQRSIKTEIRARLAMKRKVKLLLDDHQDILIRDPSDERYPYLHPDKTKERYSRGRFRTTTYLGCFHDGVRVLHKRLMAFLDRDGVHWDCAETYHHSYTGWRQDPWEDREEQEKNRREVIQTWNSLDDDEKGWFEVKLVLPYENILDIDDEGDDVCESPHVFVIPHRELGDIFLDGYYLELRASNPERYIDPLDANRVEKFPRKPDLPLLDKT